MDDDEAGGGSPQICYQSWSYTPSWSPTQTCVTDGMPYSYRGCAVRDVAAALSPALDPITRSHKCWLVGGGTTTRYGTGASASLNDIGYLCDPSNGQSQQVGECPSDQVNRFITIDWYLSPTQVNDSIYYESHGDINRESLYRPTCMCNNTWVNYMSKNAIPGSPYGLYRVDYWCYTNFGTTRVRCFLPPFRDYYPAGYYSLDDEYSRYTHYVVALSAFQQVTLLALAAQRKCLEAVPSAGLLLMVVGMILLAWKTKKVTTQQQLTVDEYVELLDEAANVEES